MHLFFFTEFWVDLPICPPSVPYRRPQCTQLALWTELEENYDSYIDIIIESFCTVSIMSYGEFNLISLIEKIITPYYNT